MRTGFKSKNTIIKSELEKIQKDVAKQKQRLKNAKDMMLDGDISSNDYKEMKSDIEEVLLKLGSDESKLISGLEIHGHLVDDGIEIIQNAEKYYHSKDTVAKQRIVSSIFPEKLIYEKNEYRTPKTLKVVGLLHRINEGLGKKKGGKKAEKSVSSLRVDPERLTPLISPNHESKCKRHFAKQNAFCFSKSL